MYPVAGNSNAIIINIIIYFTTAAGYQRNISKLATDTDTWDPTAVPYDFLNACLGRTYE